MNSGKTTSELPSKRQQDEVRYIKRCFEDVDVSVAGDFDDVAGIDSGEVHQRSLGPAVPDL